MYLRSQSRQSFRRANRFTPLNATLNAIMQALADCLLQPVIVLAAVAFLVGGSNGQVAAFATISLATWALAPIALQLLRSMSSRQYPIVFAFGTVRLLAVGTIGVLGLRIDDISTSRFIGILIAAYLVYQAATALTVQAAAGMMIGSTLRGAQGGLHRRRWIAAVIASLVAAGVGWSVFNADIVFQRAVEYLLVLATLAVLAATWFLLQIPGGHVAAPRAAGATLAGRVSAAFRSAGFRRYVSYKALLALAAAADPFLIVFGFRELGLEVSYLGLALVAYATGHALGALLWPRWISRSSARVPFQIAALLRLVTLVWIVSLPSLAASTFYTDRFDNLTAAMRGFALAFALLGLGASVGNAANQRYLLQIATGGVSQGMILAGNIVAAVFAFGPLVVAWILEDVALERVLWGAAGCAVVALLASGLLVESRARVRTPFGSWRSPRQVPNNA